jgi:hypothetical protein
VTTAPLRWDRLSRWEVAPAAAWAEDDGQLVRSFDTADAAIEFLTAEGRRRAATERQRRRYRRRVLGVGVFRLQLPEHALADRLIELGLLCEDESRDRTYVEAALEEYLKEILTRERHKSAAGG